MVAGTTTISGSFKVNDKTGIKAFVESIVSSTISGAMVFTYPDASGMGVYIGVCEGRN